jgi:alpha-amylase/alpha-mannosidase (GH57 family)
LLCDVNYARVAMPNVRLPKESFLSPEDAEAQIRLGKEYYEKIFGISPKGMWPSEGSVSDAIVPLVAKNGIQWIATDEGILIESIGPEEYQPQMLYKPYKIEINNYEVTVIFRDRQLSDLIGFTYWSWRPEDAVEDLIWKIHQIKRHPDLPENPLVTLILDGENAWEYYQNDGWDFLALLYKKLSEDAVIKTVTISEYLREHPPEDYLSRLHAGSWIDRNFRIWIGHPQDNLAWDYLSKTRKALLKTARGISPKTKKKAIHLDEAWEELYIAEGSDWFWWYGDDFTSATDMEFDVLFRNHLMNVYKILGKKIPKYLQTSILKHKRN